MFKDTTGMQSEKYRLWGISTGQITMQGINGKKIVMYVSGNIWILLRTNKLQKYHETIGNVNN